MNRIGVIVNFYPIFSVLQMKLFSLYFSMLRVHFLTNKAKMSSPAIVLPISSPPSENKTTCHFYVESIESGSARVWILKSHFKRVPV